MDCKLELLLIPVSDVDLAKKFYDFTDPDGNVRVRQKAGRGQG
jgi:hypothetical protein